MKAKLFTKTVAFRVSEAEYELLEWYSVYAGHKNVSVTVREVLKAELPLWQMKRSTAIKKLEAAAKRAAKKAENTDAV